MSTRTDDNPTDRKIRQPTVIIFVKSDSLARWAEVEAHIRQAIEDTLFEEDVEVALEILQECNCLSTIPLGVMPPNFQFGFPSAPFLGSSIRPQLNALF